MTHVGKLGMTAGNAIAQVLDFEVVAAAGGFTWTVFDCTTGHDIQTGFAVHRELALQAALRTIAERTPGALFVLRNRAGWIVWNGPARAWMPLPLTDKADTETARAFVAGLPLALGARSVQVITA